MQFLLPLAALLGIEVEAITERVRRMAMVNLAIGLLVAVALAFLLVAGYIALADVLNPIMAALIFAGVSLVLALAIYLGSRLGENRRRREIAEKRRASETSAFVTTAAVTALPSILKSPMLRTIGLPLVAAAASYLLVTRVADKHQGPDE